MGRGSFCFRGGGVRKLFKSGGLQLRRTVAGGYPDTEKRDHTMRIRRLSRRIVQAAAGLLADGLGIYLTIQASIGLAPWDVLTTALAARFSTSYGTVSMTIGFLILMVDLVLKEPIGFGMVLDVLLVGKSVDLFQWLNLLPRQTGMGGGAAYMLAGLVLVALSQWVYMLAAVGCGPRDALLVAVGKRLKRLPIGAVQFLILFVVFAAGALLGGPVGVGTLISVFGLGGVMQAVFAAVHFEPRKIVHESIAESLRGLRNSPGDSGENTDRTTEGKV